MNVRTGHAHVPHAHDTCHAHVPHAHVRVRRARERCGIAREGRGLQGREYKAECVIACRRGRDEGRKCKQTLALVQMDLV